jgi:hypothetical protein
LKDDDKAKQKLQNVKIKQTSGLSLPLARFQTKQNPPPSSFSFPLSPLFFFFSLMLSYYGFQYFIII